MNLQNLAYQAYRGYTTYRKYKPFIDPVISEMAKYARKRKRSYSKPHPNKRARYTARTRPSGARKEGLLTTQRDYYVKSKTRKPSRKTIYKRKFAKKVLSVINEHNVACSLTESVQNDLVSIQPIRPNDQGVLQTDNTQNGKDLRLGVFGNNASGLRRLLAEIYEKVPTMETLTGTKSQVLQKDFAQMKVHVKSTKATVAIRNVSGSTLQVDIYECVNKSDIDAGSYATAFQAWNTLPAQDGFSPADTFDGAINFRRTDKNDAGATPYNVPTFAKYWKILKKTRLNITDGGMTNYEYTGPKGLYTIGTTLAGTNGSTFSAGMVKDLIIVTHPTFNENTVANQEGIRVQWTKQYFFSIPEYKGSENIMAVYNYPIV